MLIYPWEEMRRELQNTPNMILLINPNQKRNKKYLVNPETIITAN